MAYLKIIENPLVKTKIDSYSTRVKKRLYQLRKLILETASQIDSISEIEETLKWQEPSYIAKKGTTIRIDWKSKSPQHYAMYFSCNTRMISTIKSVYGDLFHYEKNRAIVFDLNKKLPKAELQKCISAALRYHIVKDHPFLEL